MTKVTVYVEDLHDSNDLNFTKFNIKGIEVRGHTKKEVCNAISSLAWTLAGALVNVSEKSDFVENDDYMLISLDESPTARTNLIYETIIIGLEQIRKKHPEHIYPVEYRIKEQEPAV